MQSTNKFACRHHVRMIVRISGRDLVQIRLGLGKLVSRRIGAFVLEAPDELRIGLHDRLAFHVDPRNFTPNRPSILRG